MFSIFAMEYFHLKAKENGMVLSYVGIMSMVGIDRGVFGSVSLSISEQTLVQRQQ